MWYGIGKAGEGCCSVMRTVVMMTMVMMMLLPLNCCCAGTACVVCIAVGCHCTLPLCLVQFPDGYCAADTLWPGLGAKVVLWLQRERCFANRTERAKAGGDLGGSWDLHDAALQSGWSFLRPAAAACGWGSGLWGRSQLSKAARPTKQPQTKQPKTNPTPSGPRS